MKMISRLLADALDSTTHIPSLLMGEDKGEGDNWSGRSWAQGLPETCHCEARSAEAISNRAKGEKAFSNRERAISSQPSAIRWGGCGVLSAVSCRLKAIY